jgi:hypothetical protein
MRKNTVSLIIDIPTDELMTILRFLSSLNDAYIESCLLEQETNDSDDGNTPQGVD